jgi:hypothetical protein
MKTGYKKLVSIALSGMLFLGLGLSANAQHRGGGGGGFSGGGGGRSSGGGGFSGGGGGFSRPSGGGGSFSRPSGGGGFSRPSMGNVGVSRPNSGNVGMSRPSMGNFGAGRPSGSYGRPNMGVSPGTRGVYGGNRTNAMGSVGIDHRPNVGRGGYTGYYGRGAYRGGNYGRYGYGYGGYRGGYGSPYFNRGFYHYRGYYNSYYLPRIGFSIGVLPYGYYPFYWGDYQYYYSDGLYYQYNDNQYTVVEPPVGAQVNSLPSKAEAITINGEQYYESNGVYYRAVTKDDGTVVYEVAGKDGELNTGDGGNGGQEYDQPYQIGDVLTTLPQDSRKIKVNGEKLYVAPDGTYFQETRDNNNNKVYKVVGLSTDEPADESDSQ